MEVFIFGAGVSGISLMNFCEKRGIKVWLGGDNLAELEKFKERNGVEIADFNSFDFTKPEYIITSPSVPPAHPFILRVQNAGRDAISDLEFTKVMKPQGAKFVGITGSNGKSTTTALTAFILKTLGKNAAACGNIGISPLEVFDSEAFIMEASSYQLFRTHFEFDIAVLLNITPDHLSWHGGMEEYIEAKTRILRGKNTIKIIGVDEENTATIYKSFEGMPNVVPISTKIILPSGVSIVKNTLYINGVPEAAGVAFSNLKGEHNLQNILAAFCVAFFGFGLKTAEILEVVKKFSGLPHRIEQCGVIEGVKFVNDSKATNVDSTLVALRALRGEDIYLIAGGRAKEEGIEKALGTPEFRGVKRVFLIGESSGEFANKILNFNTSNPGREVRYVIATTIKKAISLAFNAAKKAKRRGTVLLSPMCASFDQFKNYEQRGEEFKRILGELKP